MIANGYRDREKVWEVFALTNTSWQSDFWYRMKITAQKEASKRSFRRFFGGAKRMLVCPYVGNL